ncbi:tellurite resistance TerB family protein [Pinisolibacter aquiterrae]|uniref:tellurite resistance TerB family protein n=1 Tax=Pinisolibacter aquiterrae TaxID=2815579 RepID=UPI001C3E857F|nr:tellurite resistance TerB family protein [Pinisolibacter aquiterrae]MBV5263626.1 tellurite resistance TerB family protein [Pinisolibacter aquiterrae]MCC8235176.1 tellurite resistance TerB family protein [Pinisolibacter aquiterrae]
MFDAMKLLEQLLGPQAAAGVQSTIDQGTKTVEGFVGADTIAKGKAMLGEGLGSLEATATQYVGAEKVAQAKDLFAKQGDGLAVGALAGGLLGLLVGTETGRKVGGTAVKLGSLAALGGLAWKAYQSYQSGSAGASATAPAAVPGAEAPMPAPVSTEAEQKLAAATIIAMIQAAKADGHVDAAERAAILARVGEVEAAAKAFLDTELAAPLDLDRVASLATNQQEAVHLYAASLLAIDPDQTSEKAYLDALATRLGLDAALVAEITAQVKGA